MRRIFFVTEGVTDQIVLEALVGAWLGEDFLPSRIQPPASEFARELDGLLSQGWKGVLAWCAGASNVLAASRDEVIRSEDLVVIHLDGDVSLEADLPGGPYGGVIPPITLQCDHLRSCVMGLLASNSPNVVLCVPAQDLEAWVVTCLFPHIAQQNAPIELFGIPAQLLHQRPPHKLVRSKSGALRKVVSRYEMSVGAIVAGWQNCTAGNPPACPEAVRYEQEMRAAF